MKFAAVLILPALLAAIPLSAQQDKPREEKTTIVIQQEEKVPQNYYTIRAGAWFPKDWEDDFKLENQSLNNAEATIDESQALGLDFHFRRHIGYPLSLDLAVAGWYFAYEFQRTNMEVVDRFNGKSWVIVVPITIGLSVAPLPDNPIQPYAMAGAGAYIGLTGQNLKYLEAESDYDDTQVSFGWYLGAGLDFLFTPTFGLSVAVKYQAVEIEFEKPLVAGQKDFTGVQALAGISLKL